MVNDNIFLNSIIILNFIIICVFFSTWNNFFN